MRHPVVMNSQKPWLVAAIALLILFMASFAHAKTDDVVTEDLMRKSGLWSALKEIAPQVQQQVELGMAESRQRMPDSASNHLVQAVHTAYDVSGLRRAAMTRLAELASPVHTKSLLAWFEGPLGTKITRYEEASMGLDPAAVREQGALIYSQASPQRRAQLQRLIDLTHATELSTRVVINTAIAIQVGAATSPETRATNNGQSPLSPVQLKQMRVALQKQAPAIKQAANQEILASFALTYSALSDAELQRYLAFAATPAGKHFSAITLDALDNTLTEAAMQFGRLLTQPAGSLARI